MDVLHRRVGWVTGGSRGIGAATVASVAAAGARAALSGRDGAAATGFSCRTAHDEDGAEWLPQPPDVAGAVVRILRYPGRALPSRIELRPTRPRTEAS